MSRLPISTSSRGICSTFGNILVTAVGGCTLSRTPCSARTRFERSGFGPEAALYQTYAPLCEVSGSNTCLSAYVGLRGSSSVGSPTGRPKAMGLTASRYS